MINAEGEFQAAAKLSEASVIIENIPGNLSYHVTEDDLRQAFEACGQVMPATVIQDEQSGRSKGFGFVEMSAPSEAQSATEFLNGKALK